MSDTDAHDVRPLSEHKSTHTGHVKTAKKRNLRPLILAGGALLCGLIGFGAGTTYEKDHKIATNTKLATNSSGYMMGPGGGGFGQGRRGFYNGTFGTVTAISSTSITVTNSRTGQDTTYTINSSTTVSKDTASAAVTDIQKGDLVLVRPAPSSSSTAASIVINPTMPGGGYRMMGGSSADGAQ